MSFLDSSSLSFWESVSEFGFVMVIVGGVGGGYDAVGRRNGAAEIVPCALGQIGAVLHLIGSPGHGAPSKCDDATTRSCHRLNHRRQGASSVTGRTGKHTPTNVASDPLV